MISKLLAMVDKTEKKYLLFVVLLSVDRLYRSKCFVLYKNYIIVVGTFR